MKLTQIVAFLDTELKTDKHTDNSLNGLQVEASEEVKKICFAVDATLQTINAAATKNAQLLITHHGLFWGHETAIRGLHGKRVRALIENKLSLYSSHHPLDSHPGFGHNATIAKLLGVKKLVPFGEYKGSVWGYRGSIEPMAYEKFVQKVEKILKVHVKRLSFGPKTIRKVAIVSGGGGFSVEEASAAGADVLITGETSHQTYGEAKDLGINVLFAGHYNTETFGLLELERLIKKRLKIDSEFIPAPSGL